MLKHKSPISGVATFAGQWIATAGYDNRLILWQKDQPRAVNYHEHLVNACHFSANGELIVSASSDRTARIWRVPTLEPVATLFGHEDDVEMAVFSPDGLRVATASRDHRVRLFALDGRNLATLHGHGADVTSVTWSADGRQLISSSDDGSVRRWCAETFQQLEQLPMDGIETDTVAISSSGTIYSGNDNGEVFVMKQGKVSRVKAHSAGIKRIILSRNERQLLSLSYDRHVCVFDTSESGIVRTHRLQIPSLVWARSAAFLDSNKIVFGTFGDTYAILDLATGKWRTENVKDTHGVNAVHATPDGIITVGDAGRVQVRDRDGARPVCLLKELCNFAVTHNGELFIGGQTGRIFKCPSGELLADLGQPLNCALSHGDTLLIGSYTGELFVIDPRTGAVLKKKQLLKNAIKSIATYSGMGMAVGAARDLVWFNALTGEGVVYVPEAHEKIANGCAHLQDRKFVSVSRDRALRIFEFGSQRVQKINSPHNHSTKCVATDGRRIAMGSYGGQVSIYDTESGQWIANEQPTRSGISAITYHETHKIFYASSYDGNIYAVGGESCSNS